MDAKKFRLISIVLAIIIVISAVIGIVEGAQKLSYISAAESAIKTVEYDSKALEMSGKTMTYVGFGLTAISFAIAAFLVYNSHVAIKTNATIKKWPIIVVIVISALSVILVVFTLATGEKDYQKLMLSAGGLTDKWSVDKLGGKLADGTPVTNNDAGFDLVKNVLNPILDSKTTSALKYVSPSLGGVELLAGIFALISVKKVNA